MTTSPANARWSVRTYLTWLVLACLLPGVIGAASLFVHQYNESRRQLETTTILTARALAQAVDSHLLRVQAVAQTLARSTALARGDYAAFHWEARAVIVELGLGSNVVVRDASGRQLLNTAIEFDQPLTPAAAPEQVRDVFATRTPTISNLFIGPVLKRPVMSVDVPVFIDGKVRYALGVVILPEHFNAILRAQNLPPTWISGIFDRTGTIVGRTHAPEKFVGRKAIARLLKPMLTLPEGAGETTTVEGIAVMSFYSRSPTTHWSVAIGIPQAAVKGALLRTLSLLALGVALLFAVGLALAWLTGGRIARSVTALTGPAVALGEGVSVPAPQVAIKEAASVAAALHRAGSLLQERAAALQARDEELAEAYRLAKFGTWHWDPASGAVTTSASVPEIFGRPVPDFPRQRGTLLTVDSWERINAAAQCAVKTGEGYDLEVEVNHGSGARIWINAKCEPSRNERGEITGLRGTILDITERKLTEERVRDASRHDVLTGLPNRALILEYCDRLLAASQRNHTRGALLFIDLDRFKPVNDAYGHEAGDRVLQEVGRRLIECTRQEDFVGRLGGDEFVIVLSFLDAGHRAALVAQHVIEAVSRPFRIGAIELLISPSIGISYFPEHAGTAAQLIHAADLAMYQVKQSGKSHYQFYTAELDQRAEFARMLEVKLRTALKEGGLRLHYQPVVELKTGKLIGAEALVRLADKDGIAVGPDQFIPVAEATGLIGDLGEWVAAEACRQHEAWLREGLQATIAINVSPLQFKQPAFTERLSGIISESGIDPACLEIEVTESTVMENVNEAVAILHRIKSLGVKVALDDFGTGYSSLGSLSSLPLDKLKVDQSFVRRLECDQACRAVTEAIITLGQHLGLDIHGEGIESETVLHYLEMQGCDQAQGYWFSRPLPPEEFAQWYRENGNRNPATVADSVDKPG